STTVRFEPENRTLAPLELGWSPSPASITPAFTSSSLYFPISASISVLGSSPDSEALLARTIAINRIAASLGASMCSVFTIPSNRGEQNRQGRGKGDEGSGGKRYEGREHDIATFPLSSYPFPLFPLPSSPFPILFSARPLDQLGSLVALGC